MDHNPQNSPSPRTTPVRRAFLQWMTYGLGTVAAVLAGIPLVGYFLGVRRKPSAWVELGTVTSFPEDETRLVTFTNPLAQTWDGMAANTGVFVRREKGTERQFLVLAVNCAHLGCPVSWFPQSGLFLCPCHGGVYYSSGEHASGPPPRGLYHCVWRVRRGKLEVQAPHYPTLQDTLREDAG